MYIYLYKTYNSFRNRKYIDFNKDFLSGSSLIV